MVVGELIEDHGVLLSENGIWREEAGGIGSMGMKTGGITKWAKLVWMGVLLSLLIGCAPAGRMQATPSASATPEPSQTRTPTLTPSVIARAQSNITATWVDMFTTPTWIPTFHPSQDQIGIGPEDCPGYQFFGSPPKFDFVKALNARMDQRGEQDLIMLLDYLNQYGMESLKRSDSELSSFFVDLTGDGLDEFIYLGMGFSIEILGCQEGKFRLLRSFYQSPIFPGGFEIIPDANQNGISEFLINPGYGSHGDHCYGLYEWDKNEFKNLISGIEADYEGIACVQVWAYGNAKFRKLVGDKPLELIIQSGKMVDYRDTPFGPWRNETSTYKWDGNQYILFDEEWDLPEYRFQAVQDGDRYFKVGKYDKALALYQLAITSDKLKWWSEDLRQYLIDQTGFYGFVPNPSKAPREDKNAYVALSAYAYFRIMLLYIVQGREAAARDIYNIIQRRDPTNENNITFGLLAQTFWDEYLATKNVALACEKSASFTTDHQTAVLQYLGNISDNNPSYGIHYGVQSLTYAPEDVCPVK